MAGRLLFNLKKSERKYFEIRLNDKTGQYTLETRGDVDRALSKNHTKAFEYLVQTVRAEGTVRAAISETYTLKNGVTESSRPGATIPAKDSASGEIEVYVSRQSVSAMGQPATVEGTKTEFLPAPASIVAGHEVLGHGRLQLMGQDSEQGAIDVENELRRGRGLEERKYDRRP